MPNPKAPADAPPDAFDARKVRELADVLNDTGLTEIEVERGGVRIRVVKAPTAAAQVFAPAPAAQPVPGPAAATPVEAVHAGEVVISPMVGTVYLQAQPGAPAFAQVGDTVAEGQTLLLVEAMKTMNPIIAPRAGTVIEILVADAQPVEYGEPLMVIG